MSYRDDLAAAHARIAALEAQLRSAGDPTGQAATAELARLRQENQRLLDENQRLRTLLATDQLRLKELEQLRDERNRLVERVRVLQTRRAEPAPAPAPPTRSATPVAPAPPPVAAATKRPTVWEHNRAQPALRRGEPAGVWCPTCRAAGQEVELMRRLGRFVKASADNLFESVACPRCLFTALQRRS